MRKFLAFEKRYYIISMSYEIKEESPPRHKRTRALENVLIMQGGGSLGSFACGVFKALVKQKIKNRYSCWYFYRCCKCCHHCRQ